jgi:probable HAF family extracellular repeat protein
VVAKIGSRFLPITVTWRSNAPIPASPRSPESEWTIDGQLERRTGRRRPSGGPVRQVRTVLWLIGLGAALTLSAPPPGESAPSSSTSSASTTAVVPEPPRFTLRTLGTLGGKTSEALAVNVHGEVVGDATLADGSTHAFLWSTGRMQDLGALSGANFSSAQDINDKGQIVGVSGTFNGPRSAVLWSGGEPRSLGTLPGGQISIALGINNAGDIIGVSQSEHGNRAVLWRDGKIQDLGTLPGATFSLARGINATGVVVGQSDAPDGSVHAVRWRGGKIEDLGQIRTRSGAQASTIAYAVADDGLVVGYGTTDSGALAAYWSASNPGPVAALAGYQLAELLALNDQRIAVGDATDSTQKRQIAVIVDLRRVPKAVPALFDLNTLVTNGAGWTVETASDVNSGWQIAGVGIINGARRAVLLQPQPFAVEVQNVGAGDGVVTGAGSINCGRRCVARALPGGVVTFRAVPRPGSAFSHWGGACVGTRPTCTALVGGSLTVQATFSKLAEPCRCIKLTTQATLGRVTRTATGNVQVSIAVRWTLHCVGAGAGGCSGLIELKPADPRLAVVSPPRARVTCAGHCSRNGGKASGSLSVELELTPELARTGRASLLLRKFCRRGTVFEPVGVDRVDFTLVSNG